MAATSTETMPASSRHIAMITPHNVALLCWPLSPSITIGHMLACTNTISAVTISASIAFVLNR